MPSLAAVSTIDFPHKISQQAVREFSREVFAPSFPEIGRLLPVFDNTQIVSRNLCMPLEYYLQTHTFGEQNRDFIRLALDYSVEAAEACLASAGIAPHAVTDVVVVTTTGLATPSLDALLINRMRLNPRANRMSVFGLGCAGGVSGFAKASALAKADPKAAVLLVVAELCSLTFLRNDFRKSNFIGSSLFADGIAACLILGDEHEAARRKSVRFVGSRSRLYYDTLDIMGWDFTDQGFKVLFSPGIPALIAAHVREDTTRFLAEYSLSLSDIGYYIFHPGGRKVLEAYQEALRAEGDFLRTTREVMRDYGNMSSASVLYVLKRFFDGGATGFGLIMAMGPGFSSEMVLLDMNRK
ncbi:type III polyketide synthase [Alistipes sp.]|uniref:type III polyketide synthase n=1 Tax=Alistipes sp. TaxID=1872444 RepID=UPI003AF17894